MAFFSDPNGRHFLNRTINVSDITVFVLVSTNEFITVKVFLRMFTISARLQDFTFLRHPDSSHFLDWFFDRAIDMCGITIFVLIRANKFVTVEVFFWLLTVCTRFQNLTFFGDPNSGHFLDWFFDRAIDMCGITIFVLIRANKFVTVEVFFWLLTVCTRFQNLTFFGDPNSGHFLDWFFDRAIDMGSVAIFILVGTNEFITVKVFFWFLAICTGFQNLAFFSHPNSGYLFDRFFNRTIDVSGDGTIHLCFHKLVTWECVLRFEIWCHNRSF